MYDGADVNDTMIGKYCGMLVPRIIHSTDENLFVVFSSDNSLTNYGFSVSFRSTYGR